MLVVANYDRDLSQIFTVMLNRITIKYQNIRNHSEFRSGLIWVHFWFYLGSVWIPLSSIRLWFMFRFRLRWIQVPFRIYSGSVQVPFSFCSYSIHVPFMFRSCSVHVPFSFHSCSVHVPFMFHLGSIQAPFRLRSGSVHVPFMFKSGSLWVNLGFILSFHWSLFRNNFNNRSCDHLEILCAIHWFSEIKVTHSCW